MIKLNEEAAKLRRFAELVARGSHRWVDFEEFAFDTLQRVRQAAIDDTMAAATDWKNE